MVQSDLIDKTGEKSEAMGVDVKGMLPGEVDISNIPYKSVLIPDAEEYWCHHKMVPNDYQCPHMRTLMDHQCPDERTLMDHDWPRVLALEP